MCNVITVCDNTDTFILTCGITAWAPDKEAIITVTYSRIKCQLYTNSKKYLRNDFILFVCCYLPSTIPIEVCTLQIKSLSSKF